MRKFILKKSCCVCIEFLCVHLAVVQVQKTSLKILAILVIHVELVQFDAPDLDQVVPGSSAVLDMLLRRLRMFTSSQFSVKWPQNGKGEKKLCQPFIGSGQRSARTLTCLDVP